MSTSTEGGLKRCTRCQILKVPFLEFYVSNWKPKQPCKECISKNNRKGTPKGRPGIFGDGGADLVAAYTDGSSIKQIADSIGASYSSVRRMLLKSDIRLRPDGCRGYSLNGSYFKAIDSPEKAYWLGFLATDGSVYGGRLQINLKDKEHLEKFKIAVGSTAPVKPYLSHGYRLFKIAFRSKEMVSDLSRHGITPRKSFTVKPWEGPANLLRHYWRGCIDGDGWVDNEQTGFCGNLQMVKGFIDFVEGALGFRLPTASVGRIFKTQCTGAKRQAVHDLLYWNCDVALDRKLKLTLKRPSVLVASRLTQLLELAPALRQETLQPEPVLHDQASNCGHGSLPDQVDTQPLSSPSSHESGPDPQSLG